MNRIYDYLPELTGEEFHTVQDATRSMTDEEFRTFSNIYKARRREPQTVLVLCLVGLLLLPGLQRFYVDQIGMGILYLFTLGLCFIGSIIDLVNYKKLSWEYNEKIMREVMVLVKSEVRTS